MSKGKYTWLLRIVAGALVVVLAWPQVLAASMEDAKQDKEEAEENKSHAEEVLARLESEAEDVRAYVTELNAEISAVETKIGELNARQEELNAQIGDKMAQIEETKKQEEELNAAMVERLRYMYENGNEDYMGALLRASTMCEILNEPEYVEALATYDYNMLQGLVETREAITKEEQNLEETLAEVDAIKVEQETQQADLEVLKGAQEAKAAEYQTLIDEQESLIAQYEAEIQAASAQIEAYEAEMQRKLKEAREAEAARAAAAADNGTGTADATSDTTSSNTGIATNSGDNFVPYEGGGLLWPCPSSRRITSPFGKRVPGGVVTANHYGIDIGCPDGTPIIAAASGVVVLAQYSSTAGNWIIISHGNGLYTVYMHASALYVSAGQYVNAGDTIMLSGATGQTQGRHLHYEIRSGGYSSGSMFSVDPMNYY